MFLKLEISKGYTGKEVQHVAVAVAPRTFILNLPKRCKDGGGRYQHVALAFAPRAFVLNASNNLEDEGGRLSP